MIKIRDARGRVPVHERRRGDGLLRRTLAFTMLVSLLLGGCARPGEEAHLRATIAASEGVTEQQVIDAARPPSRTEAPDAECRAKGGTRELLYDVASGWLNPSPGQTLALCVDGSGTIASRICSYSFSQSGKAPDVQQPAPRCRLSVSVWRIWPLVSRRNSSFLLWSRCGFQLFCFLQSSRP
jgi:hypothetical protein